MKQKMLLHACCGPCSTAIAKDLMNKYDIVVFFSNSNLDTVEEFNRRLDSIKIFCNSLNLPFIIDEYNSKEWFNEVSGLENEPEKGKRCEICIKYRLNRCYNYAKENGFNIIATTLTLSPYKDVIMINKIGRDIASEEYLVTDYRSDYVTSIKDSKELNLYRQKYCGCLFSKNNHSISKTKE